MLDPGNKEIQYYYPTATLVTGPDIIFFWVARMIMAGYEYAGDKPFSNVYFTGIVRDSIGRKMSKMLGNSPDALELIEKYGADGVRMGLMLAAPAGNDIMYDDKLVEQGRNFCNKIWNAFRLVMGWQVDAEISQPQSAKEAVKWFDAKLNQALEEVEDSFGKFRLSEALMIVYKLFWDEFSSLYLKMLKPQYQQPIDKATYEATLSYFDSLLRLLHPFMPFITEELWQHLSERANGESIMYAPLPVSGVYENSEIEDMEQTKAVIAGVRGVRASKNIPAKEPMILNVISDKEIPNVDIVMKLANLEAINYGAEKDPAAASFMIGTVEYNVPIASNIDKDAEIGRLHKELDHLKGFKSGIEKKLSNQRFVESAPAAVVERERKKLSDAISKIANIEATLAALK